MKITLTVFEGARETERRIFDEGVHRVGRSEFCALVLADAAIGRSHIELRVTESAVYFTNMSEAGSVAVNGKPRETGELADGDELALGPYRIVVWHDERRITVSGPSPDPIPAESFGNLALDTAAPQTQPSYRPLAAKLIFTEGPRAGEEIALEAYEVTLGRSKRADIHLDDPKLSRIHLRISRAGNRYRLIDSGSRNGTLVNGVRVLEHPLASFDEIVLGGSRLRFVVHVAVEVAPERPTAALTLVPPVAEATQTRSLSVELAHAWHAASPPAAARPKRRWLVASGVLALILALLPLGSSRRAPAPAPPSASTAVRPSTAEPPRVILPPEPTVRPDDGRDLARYLEEGVEALRERDFERAAESFQSALVIDPDNRTAALGLRAADTQVTSIEALPAEIDPVAVKREAVARWLREAADALQARDFTRAIALSSKAREVSLPGDEEHVAEAKRLNDRARMLLAEEFEPFLVRANGLFAEGDYNAARSLCDEMLRRDPTYAPAQECAAKAKEQLDTLAQEAYQTGYILESMNKIDEAIQYWRRALQYVRPGDAYYDKVVGKLRRYKVRLPPIRR